MSRYPYLYFFCGFLLFLSASVKESVREISDVSYLEPRREERLDLYLPEKENEQLRPAVVWLHGGGWSRGDKKVKRVIENSRSLAAGGYVVAAINYKLATHKQASWPQALLDSKNAVRFLRANADKYRIDPKRIAIGGESAGAHLSLLAAFTAGKKELEPLQPYPEISSEVQAVVSFYSVVNFASWRGGDKNGVALPEFKRGMTTRFLGADYEKNPALWKLSSPITHIHPGIPPVFITHGKRDEIVHFGQAEELISALEKQNLSYEFVPLESAGHTYSFTHLGKQLLEKDLGPIVVDFLDKTMPAADSR